MGVLLLFLRLSHVRLQLVQVTMSVYSESRELLTIIQNLQRD